MSSDDDTRYDGVLMTVAQECQGGVPEFFDKVFGFLARKTDFYTEGKDKECRDMFNGAYTKHLDLADKMREEKKRRYEEMDRKNREKREKERKAEEAERAQAIAQKAAKEFLAGMKDDGDDAVKVIAEVNEEEAAAFMRGEDINSKVPAEEEKEAENNGDKEEEEKEEYKGRKPNSGNGDDLDKYKWVQTLEEVELRVPLPFACKGRDLIVDMKKKSLKVQIKGKNYKLG